MGDDRTAARTKLDFLYQEVLGEVATLTTRIEGVAKQVDEASQRIEASTKDAKALPEHLQTVMSTAGKHIATDTAQSTRDALTVTQGQLYEIAQRTTQYARIAHTSAKRMAIAAVCIGAAAGTLGGLLAGLALAWYFS